MINAKSVSGGDTDLARTYLTLFCVAFEEGIVEIVDEETMATVSGLKRKSWVARMLKLRDLGLIDIKPKGTRRFGYVLLLHPIPIARKLRADGKVADGLWALFEQWHAEFSGTEPDDPSTSVTSSRPGAPPAGTIGWTPAPPMDTHTLLAKGGQDKER